MKVDGLLLALFNTYRLVHKVVVVLLLFPHAQFVSSGLLYFGSGFCLLAWSQRFILYLRGSYLLVFAIRTYCILTVRTHLSLWFVLGFYGRSFLLCAIRTSCSCLLCPGPLFLFTFSILLFDCMVRIFSFAIAAVCTYFVRLSFSCLLDLTLRLSFSCLLDLTLRSI